MKFYEIRYFQMQLCLGNSLSSLCQSFVQGLFDVLMRHPCVRNISIRKLLGSLFVLFSLKKCITLRVGSTFLEGTFMNLQIFIVILQNGWESW